MTPWLRRSSLALLLAACAPLACEPCRAEASPDLVVVAEPAASDALSDPAARGPVTLAYRVLEVFSGEPGAASVVVRHDALTQDDRSRLAEGERVILLARRDPSDEGRWVASAPLRATPSAVAAFRAWSAPEDVRASRPVGDVVAEVSRAPSGSEAVPRREPQPVEASAPAAPAAAPSVEAAKSSGRAPSPKPSPVATPAPEAKPAAAAQSAAAEPSAPAPESAVREAPPIDDRKARSEAGPGLPPAPTSRVLGPAPADRTDLKPPVRARR